MTDRQDIIAGIRALADFLETHPHVPTGIILNTVFVTMDEARQIRKGIPGWAKTADGSYFRYIQAFAGQAPYPDVGCEVYVIKTEDTCRRVQTGTRHVDAVEAHDEPVYEWDCTPDPDDDPTPTSLPAASTG